MPHTADSVHLRRRALRLGERLSSRSAELAAINRAAHDADPWTRSALHHAQDRTRRRIHAMDEVLIRTLESLSRAGCKTEAVDLCQSIARRRSAAIIGNIGLDQAPAWAIRGEEAPCLTRADATEPTHGTEGHSGPPPASSRYAPSAAMPGHAH